MRCARVRSPEELDLNTVQLAEVAVPAGWIDLATELVASWGPDGVDTHRRQLEALFLAGTRPGTRAWRVVERGTDVGFLVRSPGQPLLVAFDPARSAATLAVACHSQRLTPGELIANTSTAAVLAAAWAALADLEATRGMGLHLLVCAPSDLSTPVGERAASGVARPAGPEDAEVLRSWGPAFVREALPHRSGSADEVGERLARLVSGTDRGDGGAGDHGVWVWEHGGEVSAMARRGPLVLDGAGIALVYTPPHHRGRGVAGSLVAAVADHAFTEGARVVHLSTDDEHPVSTALYEQLGFRRIARQSSWTVGAGTDDGPPQG